MSVYVWCSKGPSKIAQLWTISHKPDAYVREAQVYGTRIKKLWVYCQ
jgi:hypothetical protein